MRPLEEIARRLDERERALAGELPAALQQKLYTEGKQLRQELQLWQEALRRQYLASDQDRGWAQAAQSTLGI